MKKHSFLVMSVSPPRRAFRFAAIRVLLTYSQVCESFTKETVLYGLSETYNIQRYTIGEELHSEAGRHVHATIVFHTKVDSRDPRLFDLNCGGGCPGDHHPNIEIIKRGQANLDRCEDYCRKEDPTPLSNVEPRLTWGEIMSTATSEDDYLSLVKKNYPRDFNLSLMRLKQTAAFLFSSQGNNILCSPTLPDTVQPAAWPQIDESTTEWDGKMSSLVIVGPTGCGKTSWALQKAPKPCLIVRHLDSLSLLRPTHKSILFDDMGFQHLPVATQKFLTDSTVLGEIHIRYLVARIPPHTTKIFTANEYPFCDEGVHGEAIRRRVTLVTIR